MITSSVGNPAFPLWEETFPGTPARGGNRPVSKPARDAEHMADGEYI